MHLVKTPIGPPIHRKARINHPIHHADPTRKTTFLAVTMGVPARRPEAFVTVTGRAVLTPASGNFKDGCAVLERPLRAVDPEFATREGRAGYLVRYREYLCPATGPLT